MDNKKYIPPNPELANVVLKQNLIILLYNLIVLAAATYVVFWKNQSGLWFILAIMLLVFPVYDFCKNEANEK
jgi:hypothetical protein